MKTFHFIQKTFFCFLLGTISLSLNAQNSNQLSYTELWQKFKENEKKDLPKDCIEVTEIIKKKAKKENNNSQNYKADCEKARISYTAHFVNVQQLFEQLEQEINKETDSNLKALRHHVIAKLYFDYFQTIRFQIAQRSYIKGEHPKEIAKWSEKEFLIKISQHTKAITERKSQLKSVKSADYGTLLPNYNKTNESLYVYLLRQQIDFYKEVYTAFYQTNKSNFSNIYAPNYDQERAAFLQLDLTPVNNDLGLLLLQSCQNLLQEAIRLNNTELLIESELKRFKLAFNHTVVGERVLRKKIISLIESEKESAAIGAAYYAYYQLNKEQSYNKELVTSTYQRLKYAVEHYPTYKAVEKLRNAIALMEKETCQLSYENHFLPNKKNKIKLTYKNSSNCTIYLYKSKNKAIENKVLSYHHNLKNAQYWVLMDSLQVTLPTSEILFSKDTTIYLPKLETGIYTLRMKLNHKEESINQLGEELIHVTHLMGLSRKKDDTYDEIWAFNRITGKPLKKVKVRLYQLHHDRFSSSSKLIEETYTNNEGVAIVKNIKGAYYTFTNNKEKECFTNRLYWQPDYQQKRIEQEQIRIFCDRAIYRPGQTIQFKGVAFYPNKQQVVAPNTTYDVVGNFNYQEEFYHGKVTTNKWGSFSGKIVLPKQMMNGYITIRIGDAGYQSIKIDSYKRPTFQVLFDPLKESYKKGDKVTIKGKLKTFYGTLVQAQHATYKIYKKAAWRSPKTLFEQNELQINTDGTFSIAFTTDSTTTKINPYWGQERYSIKVEATDAKGETQIEEYEFPIGNESMSLAITLKNNLTSNENDFEINAKSPDGTTLSKKCNYELFSTKIEKGKMGKQNYQPDKLITEGTILTEKREKLPLKHLKKGVYILKAKTLDDQGRSITDTHTFVLFDWNKETLPIQQEQWVVTKNLSCKKGEIAKVKIGSAYKEVYLLYELFQNEGECITHKWIKLNKKCTTIEVPYQTLEEGDCTMQLTFIRNGKLYTVTKKVQKSSNEQALKVRFTTFRDFLKPGDKEVWKLQVENSKKEPQQAEVLISMYDQALDKLAKNRWNLYLNRSRLNKFPIWRRQSNNLFEFTVSFMNRTTAETVRKKDIGWKGLSNLFNPQNGHFNLMRHKMVLDDQPEIVSAPSSLNLRNIVAGEKESNQPKTVNSIRSNFNETAFFYPHLTTDKTGQVTVVYTVPDALTTWNVQAVVHTKKLKTAIVRKTVITQKELMIQTNIPRFVNQGDRVEINSLLENKTNKPQEVLIKMVLLDPISQKKILSLQSEKRVVQAEQTITINKAFKVPNDLNFFILKVTAENEQTKDGEQHLIPVLSSNRLVQEGNTFVVKPDHSYALDLKQICKKGTLTISYHSNPIWFAIEELPTLFEPAHNASVNWAAALYSATLSQRILAQNPIIERVLKQEETTLDNTRKNFVSMWERNKSARDITLQETPWLLNAKTDQARLKRLIQLTDKNSLTYYKREAIQQLNKLQAPSGGWSWFKDMPADQEMTSSILSLLGELNQQSNFFNQNKRLLNKALSFSDKMLNFQYKKNEKKLQLTATTINYFYSRSFFLNEPILPTAKEAYTAYYNLLKNKKRFASFEQKAKAAIILYRNGDKSEAKQLITSLRQYARHSKIKGIYWQQRKRFETKELSTQLILLKALMIVDYRQQEINEIVKAILYQKQTNSWDNSLLKVDAITTLILAASQNPTTKNEATLEWNKQTIRGDYFGLGIIEKTISKEEAELDSKVVITNKGKTEGWGMVTTQCIQPIEKTAASKQSGLRVRRELFIQKTDQNGQTTLYPIGNKKIALGTTIVSRLIVKAERSMDYIHLKDSKAACLEPITTHSGSTYKNGVYMYRSQKDAAIHFFINHLNEGTYIFEQAYKVDRKGNYQLPPATLQSVYAPQLVGHSAGSWLTIK